MVMRKRLRSSNPAHECLDLLDHLRVSSRRAHSDLERVSCVRRLLAPDQGRAEYAELLLKLHAYHHALEHALFDFGRSTPSFDYHWHSRHAALAMDLADMSEPCRPPVSFVELPLLVSESHAVGVLYVLEGATQGGRVIAPLLEEKFGFSASHGARYFNLHRHRSWPAFREWAQVRRCRKQEAADAACRTFTTLATHLGAAQRNQMT